MSDPKPSIVDLAGSQLARQVLPGDTLPVRVTNWPPVAPPASPTPSQARTGTPHPLDDADTGNLIVTAGPAMLRVDAIHLIAGGMAFSGDYDLALELRAENVQGNERVRMHGVGPFLFIPGSGRWTVELYVGAGVETVEASLHDYFDPSLAAAIYTNGTTARRISGQTVLAAGTGDNIPGITQAEERIFGFSHVTLSNVGLGAASYQLGGAATGIDDVPLAVGQTVKIAWPECAGKTVSIFSTAGTTINWAVNLI